MYLPVLEATRENQPNWESDKMSKADEQLRETSVRTYEVYLKVFELKRPLFFKQASSTRKSVERIWSGR